MKTCLNTIFLNLIIPREVFYIISSNPAAFLQPGKHFFLQYVSSIFLGGGLKNSYASLQRGTGVQKVAKTPYIVIECSRKPWSKADIPI